MVRASARADGEFLPPRPGQAGRARRRRRARHRRRAGGAGRRPVRAVADGAGARAHPAGPPRPAPDRLGAQHRRRPAHRGGRGEGVRGELRRVRAGPRARARLPPGRRHRRDRGAGELLRHDPHPAAGRGDGGAVPAGARGQGHRHRADAPRVRRGDVPVHRRRAGGGAAAAARRRAAARADRRRAAATCTSTSPTCSTSGSRWRRGWSSRPWTALVSTEEVAAAGVTIPAHIVAAVVEAPFGAHPSSCYPRLRLRPARTWPRTWRRRRRRRRSRPSTCDAYVHAARGRLPRGRRRRTRLDALAGWSGRPRPGRSCSG